MVLGSGDGEGVQECGQEIVGTPSNAESGGFFFQFVIFRDQQAVVHLVTIEGEVGKDGFIGALVCGSASGIDEDKFFGQMVFGTHRTIEV